MSHDAYLAHHGVKGMKWGVRRYQDYGEGGYTPDGMSKRATKKISRLEGKIATRKKQIAANNAYVENRKNQIDVDYRNEERAMAGKKRRGDFSKAYWDKRNKLVNANNEKIIANKQNKIEKLKGNKDYKKSAEYIAAKKKAGKERAQNMLYGELGAARIEQLQQRGYSEKKAKG